jgi:hypothetical protein
MSGTTSEVMRVFAVVLIFGNLLALAAGVALLLAPRKVITWLGLRSTHPVSVRRVTKALEIPRNSEKVMLRYPRALGVALLAGGIYVLAKGYLFLSAVTAAEGARMLARLFPTAALSQPGWEVLWVLALVLIVIGAVLAILVGLLALLQVQTLKNLSGLTNRWISTRQAAKPASRPYYGIDRFVATHPQVLGGVISLLAIYTLVMIVWFGRGLML